jgi:hypothetical protein
VRDKIVKKNQSENDQKKTNNNKNNENQTWYKNQILRNKFFLKNQ